MQFIDLKQQEWKVDAGACVATIGFFDGVHRGHRCLIRQVTAEAQHRGLRSLLVTFANHPATVLRPDASLRLLTTADEKRLLLDSSGVDGVAMLPFTRQLAELSARDFMDQVLRRQLNVRVLVIGYDHRFGRRSDGEGFDDYVRYGRELGIDVVQATELDDAVHVSSSVIRRALESGDLQLANACLGYNYFLEGQVVSGFHVGRTIGFPTANLALPVEKLVPRRGVYAVDVEILGSSPLPVGEGRACGLRGMLNIGTRPTVENGPDVSIEVHIFDFCHNIYKERARVHLLQFIRNEKKFATVDELRIQLQHDEQTCRAIS